MTLLTKPHLAFICWLLQMKRCKEREGDLPETTQQISGSVKTHQCCYVAAWMGGEFGGEWIRVYIWQSPFAVHVKPLQHC